MNRGVCTGPWGVWKQPQRAWVRLQRAVMAKANGAEPGAAGAGGKLIGPQRCCADARGRLAPRTPLPSDPPPAGPGWLRDLAGAWIFYSVLPAWPGLTPRFARIARFAPLVGVVIGALQAGLWWMTAGWLPAGVRVALVLALALVLSGGLHHDGALDTADGLAAGPARRLEAMGDSRVGAAAVQAALLLALLRGAGLLALAARVPLLGGWALVWAAFWGRLAPLLAMHAYPYLRPDGTAAFHRLHWRGLQRELQPSLLLAGGLAAGLAFWTGRWVWSGLLMALPGLLPALLVPRWLGERLGGHSGDSYGACVEWVECLSLLLSGLLLAAFPRLAAG